MDEKIKAMFIFEILGRPPEHIVKSLEEFLEKLGKNKGIEITNKKIHEPKLIEKEKIEDFYTSFAEVELVADNLNLIFDLVLHTLPSNIEIIKPSEFRLNNFELTSVLSDLAIKIHRYDEIAKALTLERNKLINKNNEMQDKINDLEKQLEGFKGKEGTIKKDKKDKKVKKN